jgi:hypothetical protein
MTMSRRAAFLLPLLLAACSQQQQTPPPAPPSPTTPPAEAVLSKLMLAPCTALDDRDITALGVEDWLREGRQLTFHEGTSPGCYWPVQRGRVVGIYLNLPARVTAEAAGKPGAQSVQVSGYPAIQVSDAESCSMDITVGPDKSIRATATSVPGPDSQPVTCELTATFATAVLAHFR